MSLPEFRRFWIILCDYLFYIEMVYCVLISIVKAILMRSHNIPSRFKKSKRYLHFVPLLWSYD